MDFGILLGLAYHSFVEELHQHLTAAGFTDIGSSFGYLFRVLDQRDLTATQLGEHLQITTQGAAKIIDDMVAAGYVERRPDPSDRRAKRLHLAPRGRAALETVRAFHHTYEQRLAETFGPEALNVVRQVLTHQTAHPGATDLVRLFRPL